MAEINEKQKFLNKTGLALLWDRICKKLDTKLDSVTNHDESTEVTSGREIAVRISAAENNILQLKQENGVEGLYVPASNSMPHKLTFGANGEYVYDGSAEVNVPTYTGNVIIQ